MQPKWERFFKINPLIWLTIKAKIMNIHNHFQTINKPNKKLEKNCFKTDIVDMMI